MADTGAQSPLSPAVLRERAAFLDTEADYATEFHRG